MASKAQNKLRKPQVCAVGEDATKDVLRKIRWREVFDIALSQLAYRPQSTVEADVESAARYANLALAEEDERFGKK